MTVIKLKYIDRFVDRHGRERFYFRRDRGPRVALPGRPGSPEFMVAYEQAAQGRVADHGAPKTRGDPGTFDRLTQQYFSSPEYLRLSPSSKVGYRLVIENFVRDERIGHRQVREMTREHVKRMMAKRSETPGAANNMLKKLRILVHFAIELGWRHDDPCARIKLYPEGEYHTWTDEEIATYEARWPIGTAARTAFALLLHTGQRRSDVVTMSWQDVVDGCMRVVQRKTGAKLWIPVHPRLEEALMGWPRRGNTILVTSQGKAFTSNGFGNFMADRIGEARLPDRCVTHGLRKAAARRLAEAGCSANEIAAITGHATLAEVSRYTKAAEQRKLAQAAMARLDGGGRLPNRVGRVGNNAEKPNEINSAVSEWRHRQGSNLRPSV